MSERFNICLSNGLTAKQALIGALRIHQLVDRAVLDDLVLTHFPAYRIQFLKN